MARERHGVRSQTGDSVPRITVKRVRLRSKRFRSALALAESFGAPVFEPSWWPEDTGKVSNRLDGAMYWIGSIRYASEAELVQAVKSFQRVPAESD
jgi:hypothetical protein